jgi:hypothetical protein
VDLYCPEPPPELVQKVEPTFRQRLEDRLNEILGPSSPEKPTAPTAAPRSSTR